MPLLQAAFRQVLHHLAAAGASPASGIGLEALIHAVWLLQLKKMRETDNAAKALVFSQYRSTIEWLKVRLTEEGFGYRYLMSFPFIHCYTGNMLLCMLHPLHI